MLESPDRYMIVMNYAQNGDMEKLLKNSLSEQ